MPVAGGLSIKVVQGTGKKRSHEGVKAWTEVQGTLLTMQRAPEAAATTMALAALQLMAEPVTSYSLSGCLP